MGSVEWTLRGADDLIRFPPACTAASARLSILPPMAMGVSFSIDRVGNEAVGIIITN